MSAFRARAALFVLVAAACLIPGVPPALALALGVGFGLLGGNPFPKQVAKASKKLLQACVVGLGFGMPLGAVIAAGRSGVLATMAGIAFALGAGVLLGRVLRVERVTSWLISAGTAICGGSAIAAVGPAIGASAEAMTVSLATVFVLNGVALYVFPIVGHALLMTPSQFALWAAIAIHDTSSVVGAAAAYHVDALGPATVLKLARALWIVPLTLGAAALHRRYAAEGETRTKVAWPTFIALFVLATLLRTLLPSATPVFDALAFIARRGLVLTLFLIGAGLTRETLRAVGVRPLVQGVLLWMLVAAVALVAVLRWAQ